MYIYKYIYIYIYIYIHACIYQLDQIEYIFIYNKCKFIVELY